MIVDRTIYLCILYKFFEFNMNIFRPLKTHKPTEKKYSGYDVPFHARPIKIH